MKVSNTVEVVGVHLTDADTYLLSLRKYGHGESHEDTSGDETAIFVSSMIPEGLMTESQRNKMKSDLAESVKKTSQIQKLRYDQTRPHYEVQAQYKMEMSVKEYAGLGSPGVGTRLVMTLEGVD